MGDEEGAGEVCVDEGAEEVGWVVFGFEVGVDDAGAVDEDVGAAEVVGNLGYSSVNGVGVSDVEVVKLDGDFGSGVEFGGAGVAEGLFAV